MGTTAVPTGEVKFNRSEAYLIGNMKEGIYLSMEALIISRIDDVVIMRNRRRGSKFADMIVTFSPEMLKNTTIAEQDGDRFFLTGSDKYFASNAGIADAALVTARFKDSPVIRSYFMMLEFPVELGTR